jgi:hypothetical protein
MRQTMKALRNTWALMLVALLYQQTCLAQVEAVDQFGPHGLGFVGPENVAQVKREDITNTTGDLQKAAAGRHAGKADWDNLKRFGSGDKVRVVLLDSSSYIGEIRAVGDGAITVRTGPAEKTFSREDVLRVSAKGRSHRIRNALLGLLIGAGAGVAINVASPEMGAGRCAQPWPACVDAGNAAAVGLVGGAIGAAAGAAIPTGRWLEVYRAR